VFFQQKNIFFVGNQKNKKSLRFLFFKNVKDFYFLIFKSRKYKFMISFLFSSYRLPVAIRIAESSRCVLSLFKGAIDTLSPQVEDVFFQQKNIF
jgi:hypothetical protein